MSTAADQMNHLVCCCCFQFSGFLQLGELRTGTREPWTTWEEQVVQREERGDSPLDPALHGLLGLLGSQDLPGQNRGNVSPTVTFKNHSWSEM